LARARRRLAVTERCRDLAALHATLADELASPADRLACLRAYRQEAGLSQPSIGPMARSVEGYARKLLTKRRIRELRQPPLPHLAQNLIWVDGEALCVTLEFWKEVSGQLPAWLRMPTRPRTLPCVEEMRLRHGTRELRLTRRWFMPPLAIPIPGLKKTTFPSPEFEQVGALVRLQRFGLRTPRLLAVGHRHLATGGKYSFLLIEPIENAQPLHELPADGDERPGFFAQLGRFLRRIHEAGYACQQSPFQAACHWGLLEEEGEEHELVLLRLDGLERTEIALPQRLRRDLRWALARRLETAALAQLVHAYVGHKRWTAEAETLLSALAEFARPPERLVR
jgi:hypothetical protein